MFQNKCPLFEKNRPLFQKKCPFSPIHIPTIFRKSPTIGSIVFGFKAEESFFSLLFLGPSAKRFTVQRSAVPVSLRRPFRLTTVDVSKTSNSNNQSISPFAACGELELFERDKCPPEAELVPFDDELGHLVELGPARNSARLQLCNGRHATLIWKSELGASPRPLFFFN